MRYWSRYTGYTLAGLLGLIPVHSATAQQVLGKTIKAKYTLAACATTNGICAPLQTSEANIYVSPQGHVYDYSGVETGQEYVLGVTTKRFAKTSTTFMADENTLSIQSDVPAFKSVPGGNFTTIYTLRGNTCVVSGTTTFRNVRNRFTTLSCSVVDGNPN